MELKNNTLLRNGTYRILKKLGQGSFGITYLAEHTALGKKVAIKEFFMKDINSRSDDGSITGITDGSFSYNYGQKFKREALNLAKLEHPNIVRVTDCFDENSTYYYVMDFVEGENLNDCLKSHTVSENEAIAIIKDVASALTYMHDQHHMLHLDLKPGNIMRRASDGHIYLIDFGLSKHYSDDGQPETSTTIGLGTPGYAPIEQGNQARGGEFRPTIDVYALGATLYKLLTGETPPAASEVLADKILLSNKLKQKGISQSVNNLVMAAMEPVAKNRIPTVNEFSRRLAEINSIPPIPNGLSDFSHNNENTRIADPYTEETKVQSQTNKKIYTGGPQKHPIQNVIKKLMDDMVLIEGGNFKMGKKGEWFSKWLMDNVEHSVFIDSFLICRYQVTQKLWKEVMGYNPVETDEMMHNTPDLYVDDLYVDHPVVNVSWNECQHFIAKLNEITGANFRLPTEAEWEYAARGGNKSHGYKFAGSDNPDVVSWHKGNTFWLHSVGEKVPNELGLYDMSGNVYEWCQDWYDVSYYNNSEGARNPIGPNSGFQRIVRGGSFASDAEQCRVYVRDGSMSPDGFNLVVGLRLACSLI